MVRVTSPASPLVGVTLHHVTPSITIASHDAFVANGIVTVPPSTGMVGETFVPSANFI